MQAALNQARYSITRAENSPLGRWAWHAPNPAAGYDAYITEEGVTIVVNGEPCVSLSLRGFGYGAGLRVVAHGQTSADKQTINLTRDGSVQEWYVNSPDGLERGFTFAEPPAGRRPGVPLRLALQVGEGEQATASADGRKVMLRSADGRRVAEYGKLAVHDRTGRDIPARLTADGEQVFIEVEDGEATYPLTIDPVFTLQEKLPAEDSTLGDYYGFAVALEGDTAVVGAHNDDVGSNMDQGSAYVFTRANGAWSLQQKLTAADGDRFDHFGFAVALDGDTLVAGDFEDDFNSENTEQGSAYVFTRSEGVWTQRQKLTSADGEAWAWFGQSVAVSGDTVLVGAPGDDVGENYDQGSVYVFHLPLCPTLMFKPLDLPNGLSNVPYEQSVTVSGGAGPYEFLHLAGSLPPGISLSASGVLSGTPTTAGTYHFTLLATDVSSGCGSVRDYTLTVESCSVTFAPSALPDGTVGKEYGVTLMPGGGGEPYTFGVKGALPPGLSLTPGGLLSGITAEDGTFSFRVAVTDARGCPATREGSLTILKDEGDEGGR